MGMSFVYKHALFVPLLLRVHQVYILLMSHLGLNLKRIKFFFLSKANLSVIEKA